MSKASAPTVVAHGPVEDRSGEADGYTINFVSFGADIDGAPLLAGLPEDRCSCPHWGYVISGRATFAFGDHDEVYAAGDAYYLPPGHTPQMAAGTEIVQFSPTHDLQIVEAVMMKNAAAMLG
jgi:hypothetical protein